MSVYLSNSEVGKTIINERSAENAAALIDGLLRGKELYIFNSTKAETIKVNGVAVKDYDPSAFREGEVVQIAVTEEVRWTRTADPDYNSMVSAICHDDWLASMARRDTECVGSGNHAWKSIRVVIESDLSVYAPKDWSTWPHVEGILGRGNYTITNGGQIILLDSASVLHNLKEFTIKHGVDSRPSIMQTLRAIERSCGFDGQQLAF